MRKLFICISIIAAILSGCAQVLGPKHLEDPAIKKWVFLNSDAFSVFNELDSFMIDPSWDPLEEDEDLSEAVCVYFRSNLWWTNFIPDSRRSYLKLLGNPDFDNADPGFFRVYSSTEQAKYYRSILLANREKATELYQILVDDFYSYIENTAQYCVSVLNWSLDRDAIADEYTGYFVEYEVNKYLFDDDDEIERYYVLLALTEFKHSERYQIKMIYDGKSLNELHNCYE